MRAMRGRAMRSHVTRRMNSRPKGPDMTPDSIERDTRALALPEGRRVGQPGHDRARDYLHGRLGELGLEPFHGDSFALPYEGIKPLFGEMHEFTNLVGRVRGTEEGLSPFLIGAHYDSVIDAPCADDNATAVAVALAAAETFHDDPLRRDVLIALFDAEEPPFFLSPSMGSNRFYEAFGQGMRFACALVMDLIGHDVELGIPGLEETSEFADLLCVLGSESHETLPPAVETAAASVPNLSVLPTLNSYIGDMSDHGAFRRDGQPYLFLTCGQGEHYHTRRDTVDWVNFDKVRRVHEFVVATLRELDDDPKAGSPTAGISGSGTDFSGERAAVLRPRADLSAEQADFEIRMIERALGDGYGPLLGRLGLSPLRSREDLDRFVMGLASCLLQ